MHDCMICMSCNTSVTAKEYRTIQNKLWLSGANLRYNLACLPMLCYFNLLRITTNYIEVVFQLSKIVKTVFSSNRVDLPMLNSNSRSFTTISVGWLGKMIICYFKQHAQGATEMHMSCEREIL